MCSRVCKDSSLRRLLNGTNTSSDRASIQAEVTALSQEITRIACRTSFGGKKVLSAYGTSESIITSASISGGKVTGKINFQVGSNHDDLQTLDMNIYENNRSGTVTKKTAGTAAATTGTTTTPAAPTNAAGETEAQFNANAQKYLDAYNGITDTNVTDDKVTVTLDGGTTVDVDVSAATTKDANGYKEAFLAKVPTYLKDNSGTVGKNVFQPSTTTQPQPSGTTSTTSGDDINIFSDPEHARKGYSLENLMRAAGLNVGTTGSASFQVAVDGTTTGTDYTVFDVRTSSAAQATLASIDKVINLIDTKRGDFGALENRMSSTISNQTNIMNNESDARSRIRDTDYAEEASNLSAQSIVQQAASSMLTQANSLPQMAL